ncbi:hypothetical protein PQX77_018146 [Marasmius sp. AFHP31]|nr:hypothetical protein PQX77_018146 [Marasmius sp. AFHP31]
MPSQELDEDDRKFIEQVPTGILMEYRDKFFPQAVIEKFPSLFLTHDWVKIDELKQFYQNHHTVRTTPVRLEPPEDVQARVKLEETDNSIDLCSNDTISDSCVRVLVQNGRQIYEILDSDDEEAVEVASCAGGARASSRCSEYSRLSSPTVVGDVSSDGEGLGGHLFSEDSDEDSSGLDSDAEIQAGLGRVTHGHTKRVTTQVTLDSDSDSSETELDRIGERHVSSTQWYDPRISSEILESINTPFCITREKRVHSLEFVKGVPLYLPVPRGSTAYIFDFRGPEYDHFSKDGKLLSPDAILKNGDQDSWNGGSGARDSTALTSIFQHLTGVGSERVKCRRSRLDCGGVHACEKIDSALLPVERYELDESVLQRVVEAQAAARIGEGSSSEKLVIIFWNAIHAKPCSAVDDDGCPCHGVPVMKKMRAERNGKQYFITCSGWKPGSNSHKRSSIPEKVSEALLLQLFDGQALGNMANTACVSIVPSRIGGKMKRCS